MGCCTDGGRSLPVQRSNSCASLLNSLSCRVALEDLDAESVAWSRRIVEDMVSKTWCSDVGRKMMILRFTVQDRRVNVGDRRTKSV